MQRGTWSIPEPCKRNTCLACAYYRARILEVAIRWSNPTHFLTIAQLPADPVAVARFWRCLLRRLQSQGKRTLEWIRVTERHQAEGLVHVHALLRGDVPTARQWTVASEALGAGSVDLRKCETDQHASYVLKVFRGDTKRDAFTSQYLLDGHLALNGGRPLTPSRGFFLDQDGQPAGGLRGAEKCVRRYWRDSGAGYWTRVG